jgi:hypothetical protein
MDSEGNFRLVAVVGQSATKPHKWHAAGYVHAAGENEALEVIKAGDEFETRHDAHLAGIAAARDLAKTLRPDDSRAKRRVAGAGQ